MGKPYQMIEYCYDKLITYKFNIEKEVKVDVPTGKKNKQGLDEYIVENKLHYSHYIILEYEVKTDEKKYIDKFNTKIPLCRDTEYMINFQEKTELITDSFELIKGKLKELKKDYADYEYK